MPTSRRKFLALPFAGLLLAACGGGKGGSTQVTTVKNADWTPLILTTEQVVGENRFVIGILDKNNVPVVDAKVDLKFYDLNSGQAVLKADTAAPSRVPARDANLPEQIKVTNPDGSTRIQVNQTDAVGYYITNVSFDEPGNWGVEVNLDSQKPKLKGTQRISFNVIPQSITPAVGSPAPRSRNRTVRDVQDISEIDSSADPSPEMHTSTIADAIAAGRPVLVLFAAPGFCTSALCGPEYAIMKRLYGQYKDRVEFIHVEFYNNPGSPDRTPVDVAQEWHLQTEPWFFVIDSHGIISAKFEGPATVDELQQALQKVI
jgi:hypothetical protein